MIKEAIEEWRTFDASVFLKHTTKYKHEEKGNYTLNQIKTIADKIKKVEELYRVPGIYQYI